MKRGSRGGVRRGQKQKTVLLPPELINEILLRLPVKSLLRFKSVCKSWLSLISDPHFAISHYEVAATSRERLMFLAPRTCDYLSIDFNLSLKDNSAFVALHRSFRPPKSFLYEILGSCRGFLLLICRRCLYVWNPSTGFRIILDWSPIVLSKRYYLFITFLRGFGYDPSTDDYLVVIGSYDESQPQHDRVTRVEYFSVRANSWKELEDTHFCYKQCSDYRDNQVGCLFNGVLHWLAFRYDVLMIVIVAFDLTQRSVLEISLPVDFEFSNFRACHLRVLKGLFSLCAVELDHTVEIWVMEKYKVQSSWTKTIVVSVENIPTSRCFFPLCSTKNGDLFGTNHATGLVKCNDKGQLQEHRSYFSTPNKYAMAVYEETLLSLPYDSKQAS